MKYFLNTNTNEKYGFSQNDDIPSIFFEAPFIEISVNEIDEMNKPSFSLEELKASKLNEITNARTNELNQLTCEWGNDTWDARETDSTRVTNVLTMIEQAQKINIPTPPTVDWRTYDDQDRTLTVTELIQLAASMFMQQQIVWAKQANLKNQVLAATTEEEINQINW